MLETGWQFEESHEEGYTDVFHISSDRRLPVTLRLGMTAANLLIEEFPLAEKYMEREDDAHWLFHTEVCKYEAGVPTTLASYSICSKNRQELVPSGVFSQM